MLLKNLIGIAIFVTGYSAMAQESQPLSRAKNIIYAEVETAVLYSGMISLNYERVLSHRYTIRAAYIRGLRSEPVEYFFFLPGKATYDNAASLTGFYTNGDFNKKFELGGGIAYVLSSNIVAPVIAIGYRWQPYDRGMFYRTGFEYAYFWGIQVSAGYSF